MSSVKFVVEINRKTLLTTIGSIINSIWRWWLQLLLKSDTRETFNDNCYLETSLKLLILFYNRHCLVIVSLKLISTFLFNIHYFYGFSKICDYLLLFSHHLTYVQKFQIMLLYIVTKFKYKNSFKHHNLNNI